jgi:tetratricopeptide (TPR) repeat protein
VKFWLAQALAQARQYERALALYSEVAAVKGYARIGEALLGKARMLEAAGRLNEALVALGEVPKESRVVHPARLSAAELLIEAGGLDQASLALEGIRDPNRRDADEKTYLRARIELGRGEFDAALASYDGLDARNRRLSAGQAIGVAEARLRRGEVAEAERGLETFIRDNARSPLLGALMAKLDEVYDASTNPVNAELKRFEEDDHAPLSALATFYLARNDERQGRVDRAERTYREFLAAHPNHPLRGEATIRLTDLLLAGGKLEAAVRTLADAAGLPFDAGESARLNFLRGESNFRAGNHAESVRYFREAAGGPDWLRIAALANAALAAGFAPGGGAADLAVLREADALAAERIELAVALSADGADRGRTLAALRRLSEEATNPAVRSRAALGIAEWNWTNGDLGRARSNFQNIANGAGGEQADYFAIYVADDGTPGGGEAARAAAERFVADYPESAHVAEARMKWGEVLARTGDHRGARAQFERAAEVAEDDGERVAALFLAARSAAWLIDPAMLEEAVELFERVRRIDGPLATRALLEQALLFNALGRSEEALGLFDRVTGTAADPRLRVAALLKKGDTLSGMATDGGNRTREAIAVWRAVAEDASASASERNEALAKAASANERLGEFDPALAGYYEVLNAPRDGEPEYFWYYKAGFDAARLLEERDQLREASAIYEKMAATEGPRSEEAAERVKHLRLENFIWDN